MTREQHKFWSDIMEVSPTLADWVRTKFETGHNIAEVRKMLRDAAIAAERV